MILLTATTDKLQIITGQACDLDVHVSAVDYSTSTAFVRQNTNITTATTTDILAAPAASTTRNARNVNVRNAHATNPVDVTVQFNQNSTLYELHKATLQAGDLLEYAEGYGFFVVSAVAPGTLLRVNTADDTGGQNVATAQPWFPTTGGVTVTGSTTYRFRGQLYATRAAGTTSHTTGLLFGGTASLTSIDYVALWRTGDANAAAAVNQLRITAATNTAVKAASTSATEDIDIRVEGVVRINAGGTFIPQFQYSAAPGGAPTIKRNSFFEMVAYGDGNLATLGTWA